VKQLRRLFDEARRVVTAGEARVRDELVEEAQVGDHAADAKLPQCAVHARDGLLGRRRPRRHLHQQRVVGAGDDRAAVGGAGIEPDAEAGRTAVGGDLAVVRDEVVFGILGGDAALQGVGADADVGLRRHAALGRADARAVGDADLRLHQVDAGRALGDRVLDLDARIHLDEIAAAAVGVLQEFDRAGVVIVRGAADGERRGAQLLALRRRQKHRRCALHHLLVAALHGAVALEQVHQGAVVVAEQLHFHVPCARDQLLQVHLVVAEGGLGFAPRDRQQFLELRIARHHAHAAAAAPPAGLEHHRVADAVCQTRALLQARGQRCRGRHHRHTRRHRQLARRHLVAEQAQSLGLRTDEHHARLKRRTREFGVLGQEAVARMNRIHPRLAR
jgi:hypothetical protein